MNLKSICLCILLLFSVKIFAWGTTGHRVVAEIAERNLSSRAKRNLKKIIGDQKLAFWANWPDFIKSDTTGVWKDASQWHYVNVDGGLDYEKFVTALKSQPAPNLYTKIQELSAKIKDGKTDMAEREIALRFLVHLLGDLAQPLHVGRDADRGGNDIKLKFVGQPTNLHAVWDDKLVEFQKYSYTEYADVLLRQAEFDYSAATNGNLASWFYDSYTAVNKIYGGTMPNGDYSFDYNYKFSGLMNRQLTVGGLRLAKILNEILN